MPPPPAFTTTTTVRIDDVGQDIEELDDEAATALAGIRWQKEVARRQAEGEAAVAAARAVTPAAPPTGSGQEPTAATLAQLEAAAGHTAVLAAAVAEAAGQAARTAATPTGLAMTVEGGGAAAVQSGPAPAPPPWQPMPPSAAVTEVAPTACEGRTAGATGLPDTAAPGTPTSDGESSSTSTSSGLSGSTVTAEQMEEIKRRPANWRNAVAIGVVSDPSAYAGDRRPAPLTVPVTPRRARRSPSTEEEGHGAVAPALPPTADAQVEWVPVVVGSEPSDAGAAAGTVVEGTEVMVEGATAGVGAVDAPPAMTGDGAPSLHLGTEMAAPTTPLFTAAAPQRTASPEASVAMAASVGAAEAE